MTLNSDGARAHGRIQQSQLISKNETGGI